MALTNEAARYGGALESSRMQARFDPRACRSRMLWMGEPVPEYIVDEAERMDRSGFPIREIEAYVGRQMESRAVLRDTTVNKVNAGLITGAMIANASIATGLARAAIECGVDPRALLNTPQPYSTHRKELLCLL